MFFEDEYIYVNYIWRYNWYIFKLRYDKSKRKKNIG